MKNSLLIAFSLLIVGCALAQTNELQQSQLSKEILNMKKEDQNLRKQYANLIKKGKTKSDKFKKVVDELIDIDRNNTARMNEIIDEYGWPTYDLVGRGASNAAWLIVQHADRNPLFQAKCLPLLKAAMDRGQATPYTYAYLYDRVQLAFGRKQLYATQSTTNNGLREGFFQPIEDEANIQIRRDEMGIEPHVEEYASSMDFVYTIPNKEEAVRRALAFANSYKENVVKAKAAMKSKDYTKAVEFYQVALESDGYTKTEDYVEYARAISLSNHEECSWAAYFLRKAAIRGYENYGEFDTHPDFKNIKEANENNWFDLMQIVKQLNKTK